MLLSVNKKFNISDKKQKTPLIEEHVTSTCFSISGVFV
jgi:hypothetical protein